jgi:LDH2 family malate/lactate/ureidoglycolate dehydrogenase
MAGVDTGILFPHEMLRAWTQEVFRAVGVPFEDAAILTDSMVEANLRGVDTHGLTRLLCTYVRRIQKGVMNSWTELVTVRESASTALLDCKNSIGQVGAAHAMRLAIKKAADTGVALVAVSHSNHYGAAAYWAMMALPQGMIGFSSTNAPATVAPTGGRRPMLGTNPFAVAIPAAQEQPFVLDLATTVVPYGRIFLHAKQNKPLEPGWAFDECGRPTVDPQAALKGFLAPIGGYKGYGISLAIDLLCGVMTGSSYGAHFPGFLADNLKDPTDVGSIFAALRIESFMDLDQFTKGMDRALCEIKCSARAEGVKRIYVPGEIEFETKVERLAKGIPIPEQVLADFVMLGKEVGVLFPQV